MLQIASGKLFQKEAGQRNELRGVAYTNLVLLNTEIETKAGRLRGTSAYDDSVAIYEITELIEEPPDVGVVASHGVEPYLQDFAAVVSFTLDVTCTPDVDFTRRLTKNHVSPAVRVHPRKLIRRVYDDRIWCQEHDATRLQSVVSDLIDLTRKDFLSAMRAIRTYVTALHRLVDDLNVAYTLLVASIESLAATHRPQSYDWKDYDEGKRRAIDKALRSTDEATAARVRAAILKIEPPSASRRFRDFTLDHITPSFFRDESEGLPAPVARRDLGCALTEAYRMRSRYIHSLRPLPGLISLGVSQNDTLYIRHNTFFTFQGLSRLARHVILEFISRQPKVATEVYDYGPERAGIIQVELAPQYWVGNAERLTESSSRRYLNALFEQMWACIERCESAAITREPAVLAKIEEMLPRAKKPNRLALTALYFLLNCVVSEEDRMPNADMVIACYKEDIDGPNVESLLVHLVLDRIPEWATETHKELHDCYFSGRDRKGGLRVPRGLEAGLSLSLAERLRLEGRVKESRELVTQAVESFPGNKELLDCERNFDGSKEIIWRQFTLSRREESPGTAET